jgi:type I restriction enzyme, R subunit
MTMDSYLSAEEKARVEIDRMLEAAGWAVQNARGVNLGAACAVAIREFIAARRAADSGVLRSSRGRATIKAS